MFVQSRCVTRALFKRLAHASKWCCGPGENGRHHRHWRGWACAFKIESHNHTIFMSRLGAATAWAGIPAHISPLGARLSR